MDGGILIMVRRKAPSGHLSLLELEPAMVRMFTGASRQPRGRERPRPKRKIGLDLGIKTKVEESSCTLIRY